MRRRANGGLYVGSKQLFIFPFPLGGGKESMKFWFFSMGNEKGETPGGGGGKDVLYCLRVFIE